ncbi:hypothetical protein BVY05_05995 [Pectobacterium odoriferum]|nr:hypothetical protein BVY05_05995 [Pectobacterium odoriferum]POE05538.1 hypothetical protein BV916_08650 [Pectobacterium odoriferum]
MFFSTVNGRIGIVMNVVMTKARILRHVGQLTSKNYARSVKASRGVPLLDARTFYSKRQQGVSMTVFSE